MPNEIIFVICTTIFIIVFFLAFGRPAKSSVITVSKASRTGYVLYAKLPENVRKELEHPTMITLEFSITELGLAYPETYQFVEKEIGINTIKYLVVNYYP